jgi:hypothetical protein
MVCISFKLAPKTLPDVIILTMKKLTKIYSLILFTTLFSSSTALAIVGGNEVKSNSVIAQSVVALYNRSSESFCTGTIIAPHWIMTAAHCVVSDVKRLTGVINPRSMTIIFGNFDRSTDPADGFWGSTPTTAKFVIKHPDFGGLAKINKVDRNDIALVRFDSKLPASFKPMTIISEIDFSTFMPGDAITIAGYGKTSSGSDGPDGILRSIDMVFDSFGGLPRSIAQVVPHEGKAGGACPGDSGGPAFVKFNGKLYVWGVASTTREGCKSSSIYGSITGYADWLKETIENNPSL